MLRSRRSGPIALSLIPALLLGVTLGALILFSPEFRSEVTLAWGLLWEREPEALMDWLLSYGWWAPLISGLLQLVTSIFPPGPSFLLGIVNAMLYGVWFGGVLTFVTALVAAAVCFGIGRVVGRPGVERLVSAESLGRVDGFMEEKGMLAVFVARLIPFINPDIVSYVAGVTRIGWIPFLLAVGAGAVPSTVFYSVVGATAVEATGWVLGLVATGTLLPILILALFGRRIRSWWDARQGSVRE